MISYQALRFAAILSLGLGFPMASLAADKDQSPADNDAIKGTTHSVGAGVEYPATGGVGIQAEKQPGAFTIPKGSTATKLKYEFSDPKSDQKSTKLTGSNIYSVTEHRYMHELDKDPDFKLPPGDYKFVVGGYPGAMGNLTYTTVPVPAKQPPKGTVHSVDASMGYPTDGGVGIQAEKQPGSFTIPKGSTATKLTYEFYDPKSGDKLTKLRGSNVFSVTEHRYMEELDKDPNFELPPGDYKFVVGGYPGATGRLTYTAAPAPDKKPPKGTIRTVDASMGYPTNGGVGTQAEKQPGSFTIPKGSAATKLTYEFYDPKSGDKLTKLRGSNVFSMTEHRYMEELDKDPDFELPAGDYKFVVGGYPGATGRLTYTEIPASEAKPPRTAITVKKKKHRHPAPPAGPIVPTDAVTETTLNPTSNGPIAEDPGQGPVDVPVSVDQPPQSPPPTVRQNGRCPHCNQYHHGSHTGGSTRTHNTSRPPSTTTNWLPPPATTKNWLPPSTTKNWLQPPRTTKRPPPPHVTKKVPPPQTIKKVPPPQVTKKVPPPSQTTKKTPPPQTTKKSPPPTQTTKTAGPPSLDRNKSNYIGNVLQNGAIQKKAPPSR